MIVRCSLVSGIGLFFIVHICVLSHILEKRWLIQLALALWPPLSLARCRCVVFAPFNHRLNQRNENGVRNTHDMAEENKNDSMCNVLMRNGRVISKRSKWVSVASSIRSIKLALNETVVSYYHFFDFQCDVVWMNCSAFCYSGSWLRTWSWRASFRSRMHFIRVTHRGIIYSFIFKYLKSGSMRFTVAGCKVCIPNRKN